MQPTRALAPGAWHAVLVARCTQCLLDISACMCRHMQFALICAYNVRMFGCYCGESGSNVKLRLRSPLILIQGVHRTGRRESLTIPLRGQLHRFILMLGSQGVCCDALLRSVIANTITGPTGVSAGLARLRHWLN